MTIRRDERAPIDIGISSDTLAYIVLNARAYDALVSESDPIDGHPDAWRSVGTRRR